MHRGHKVILTVFAGRRDRMALFLKHADRLVAEGHVDEVHLWDYCRAKDDRAWVRGLAASPLVVAGYDYCCQHAATEPSYAFRVHNAQSDVCVLLTTPAGVEYELVICGWKNTMSAFRLGRQGEARAVTDSLRLNQTGWTDVALAWGQGVLEVRVNGEVWSVPFDELVATLAHAAFESCAVYDAPPTSSTRYRLCTPTEPKWGSYYTHYNAYWGELYANSILIKADDDMVHMGSSSGFCAFLDFCLDNPQYGLVLPNIVNNGVAAHFQKHEHGLLQGVDIDEEIPPVCGMLWESGARARTAHEEFLANPAAFEYEGFHELRPKQRVSINMFATTELPPTSLFAGAGEDDEVTLTANSWMPNAIFNGFSAAHLSFYSQERSIGPETLIAAYEKLLEPAQPAAAEPAAAEPAATEPVAEPVKKTRAPRKKKTADPVKEPAAVTQEEPVVSQVTQEEAVPGGDDEPVFVSMTEGAVKEEPVDGGVGIILEEPDAEVAEAPVAEAASVAEAPVAKPKRRGRAPKKSVVTI